PRRHASALGARYPGGTGTAPAPTPPTPPSSRETIMPRPFATPPGTPAAPCFLVSTTVLPGSSRTPAVMPAIPRPNLRAAVCALADEANARIHTSNATPASAGTLRFLEPLWPFIGYLP